LFRVLSARCWISHGNDLNRLIGLAVRFSFTASSVFYDEVGFYPPLRPTIQRPSKEIHGGKKKTTDVSVSLSPGIPDRYPHAKPSPLLRRTLWLAADA
jgi:hypothetical protein